ncbi:extensin family protein [Paracoccus halophilus]|uniref:extensin-like domain-containing protein n=1 Tax=Paracoccus halophilus TaxID=376733 RepID=UPI001E46E1BD|nr:extensin family protein [Paracoccus halophilus]
MLLLAMSLPSMAQETPPGSDPAARDQMRPAPRPEQALPSAGTPTRAAAGQAAGPDPAAPRRESDPDYAICLLDLTLLGAGYSQEPAITDSRDPACGIARPILLRRPLPGVEIAGGALMRCDTARRLGLWLRDFVLPAAARLPGQPRLTALEPGSTYECRPTIGDQGRNLSEHAYGNAFDIMAFHFDNGSRLAIRPRSDNGDWQEAFQRAARATACLHFTTVLGPGANAAHDQHLHLDSKYRRGGWRLCQ